MEFTLEDSDTEWVNEIITRATEELKQTTPNGRTFAEMVSVILEREKNWVRWKNELCMPFDKESAFVEIEGLGGVKRKAGLFEATSEERVKMREGPAEFEHRLGTKALTDIWDMGCRDLEDLQIPFR
jgi:hypothetical protein